MKEMTEPTPVALYARVSSENQDVELSIGAQLAKMQEYADRNNCVVTRTYTDEAISGSRADRPQFTKMIREASGGNPPFREILVWNFSRFSRRLEHAVRYKGVLREHKIKLTSITEPSESTPAGRLMEFLIDGVNEFFIGNLSEDVTRGQRYAHSLGYWMGANVPFGYQRTYVDDRGKKRPTLEIDEPKAKVVKRIFAMALDGKTLLEITKTLNGEGVPSPRKSDWGKGVVRWMLRNEVYTGTNVRGKRSNKDIEIDRVPNAFPPIVSTEDFNKVQEKMASKSRANQHPRRVASRYVLSGLVKCEKHQRAMTARGSNLKYGYYTCGVITEQGADSCDTPRLNTGKFDRLIVGTLLDNVLTDKNIWELVQMVADEVDDVTREEQQRLEIAEHELAEVKRRRAALLDAVENQALTYADVSDRMREIREHQEKLEYTVSETRGVLAEQMKITENAERIAKYARSLNTYLRGCDIANTKAFIQSFVKEILVRPGSATIRYTIPMPPDGPAKGKETQELALEEEPVLSLVLPVQM